MKTNVMKWLGKIVRTGPSNGVRARVIGASNIGEDEQLLIEYEHSGAVARVPMHECHIVPEAEA